MQRLEFLDGKVSLYCGDNRIALKDIPDNSICSCVTDPPYALVSIVKRFGKPGSAPAKGNDAYMRASAGFMSCTWDTGETAFSEEFWREVLRVLKPGGHVAAFGASRGYHRMACAIEDAGFEIRDSLMWVYGTGFPKSHDVAKGVDKMLGVAGSKGEIKGRSKLGGGDVCTTGMTGGEYHEYVAGSDAARQWEGWGTALKPAFEPIVLARKPLSEGTVAANVLRWGTGALNIDGCRVGDFKSSQPSGLHRGKIADYSPKNADDFEPALSGATGRWPANVVHDGSDEVVGAFPNTHGAGKARTAAEGTHSGPESSMFGIGGAAMRYGDAGGSAARFFYSAKASKADRAGSKHPTVKPIKLLQWLTRLITPPGGMVLDPFAGSGTTAAACSLEGFSCTLIEREDEYVADIERRLTTAPSEGHVAANDNGAPDLFRSIA